MTWRILALLGAISLSLPVLAADLRYGIAVDSDELTTLLAYHSRGVDLDLGRNGPVDRAEAARWYQRSAVLGFPLSQYRLARHYEAGAGMARDYVLAYLWYDLAANNGDPLAEDDLGRLATHMTSDELRDARQLVQASRRVLSPPTR